MSSTFFERLGQNPVVIAILLFDGVSSLIFFLFPLTLFFLGDVCVFIGMIISLAYIFYPKEDPINIPKTILLTAFLGGIVTALSFTIVIFLLLQLEGKTISLLDSFLNQAVYIVALALTIGIIVILIIKVKDSLIKKESSLLELEKN